MQEFKSERELLEEIRDLLQPISAVYRPQYDELMRSNKKEDIEQIMDIVGRGDKKIAASRLMNGSRTRKEIVELSKIDSGELSRLVNALKDRDLAAEEEGRPNLVVEPSIIWTE